METQTTHAQVLPVPPENAYEMWGTIRPGVIEVLRATGGGVEPEQVLEKLARGECLLWVGYLSGYVGFAVTRVDEVDGHKSLFVWMAHNSRRDVDTMHHAMPVLEAYAMDVGCDVIDTNAAPTHTRSGKPMSKRLGDYGFKQHYVAYRKVL